jgi:hypothetical protein
MDPEDDGVSGDTGGIGVGCGGRWFLSRRNKGRYPLSRKQCTLPERKKREPLPGKR